MAASFTTTRASFTNAWSTTQRVRSPVHRRNRITAIHLPILPSVSLSECVAVSAGGRTAAAVWRPASFTTGCKLLPPPHTAPTNASALPYSPEIESAPSIPLFYPLQAFRSVVRLRCRWRGGDIPDSKLHPVIRASLTTAHYATQSSDLVGRTGNRISIINCPILPSASISERCSLAPLTRARR